MQNLTIDSVCTKGPIYPTLIDFENGYPMENIGITCAVVLQDKDQSRTIALEVSEQAYAGREKKEDSGKTLILARNRKTGKTRLIEMGYAELRPFTETDLIDLEKQESSISAVNKKVIIKKHVEIPSTCDKAIQTDSVMKKINVNGLKKQETIRPQQSLYKPPQLAPCTFDSATNTETVMNHKRKASVEWSSNGTATINDTLCLPIVEKNAIQPSKTLVLTPNASTTNPTTPKNEIKLMNHSSDFKPQLSMDKPTDAPCTFESATNTKVLNHKRKASVEPCKNATEIVNDSLDQTAIDRNKIEQSMTLVSPSNTSTTHTASKNVLEVKTNTSDIESKSLVESSRNGSPIKDTLCHSKIEMNTVQKSKTRVPPPNASKTHPTAPKNKLKVKKQTSDFVVPPYNKDATSVEDIYPIEEILSINEYEKIYSELKGQNYADQMNQYVQDLVQDKILSPQLTVLAVYASQLIKFKPYNKCITCNSKTLTTMLVKKLKNLQDKPTNGVSFWDRKVCDTIVLLLIINNFKLKLRPLCAALRLSDIETKISLIGATIVSNNGEEMVQLKLPPGQKPEELSACDNSNANRSNSVKATPAYLEFWKPTLELCMDESNENEDMEYQENIDNDFQTVNEREINVDDLDLYILPRDRESTDDLDSLQQHGSTSEMKLRKHNKRKRKKSEYDVQTESIEKENKNHYNSVRKMHDECEELYILPREKEDNVEDSDSSDMNKSKKKKKKGKRAKCDVPTDSEEMENRNPNVTANQLDTVHDENDLDGLHIFPRHREASECDSESIKQHKQSRKHKKKNKYKDNSHTDSENGNSYVTIHNLDVSLPDKSDSNDLYNLPREHKKETLKREKAKDFTKSDAKNMKNEDSVKQEDVLSDENIDSSNRYSLRARGETTLDSESTIDSDSAVNSDSTVDSESAFDLESAFDPNSTSDSSLSSVSSNKLNRKKYMKVKNKTQKPKDKIRTKSWKTENGRHNDSTDQQDLAARDRNAMHDLHVLPHDEEEIDNGHYNGTVDHRHLKTVDYVYIPPINKEATEVEDIYPIDEILSEDEYKQIYSEIQGVEYKLNKYVRSVVKNKKLSPKLTVLALYASELIKLLHYKWAELLVLHLTLCHSSQTLNNILFKCFTTFQKYTNLKLSLTKLMRIKTEPLRDKIVCHIIVIMLILGDFELEFDPLCKTLMQVHLNYRDIQNMVPLLGGSFVERKKRTFIQLSLPLPLKSHLDRSKLLKQYYVPPVNSKASRVEELYPVEKILTESEYEKIYCELQEKYNLKKLHPYVKSLIKSKTLSPQLTVLAVYASDLLKFNEATYLGKDLVISKFSETLNDILMREFTETTKSPSTGKLKRIRPPTLCEKLVCHVMVLAFILNNFVLELEPLRAYFPIALEAHYLKIVGASIMKNEDGRMLQLKLPTKKIISPTVQSDDIIPEDRYQSSNLQQFLRAATVVLSTERVKNNGAATVQYLRSNDEYTVDFYIPPVNRDACEIAELYPVEKILSESEYKMIYQDLQQSDAELHPYVKSLVKDRNQSPNLKVLAFYASELLKFLHRTFPDIRYMKTACHHSTTLDNIIKKEFTVLTKYCREDNSIVTQRYRTQPFKDKLVCHLLVFLLILNDFKLKLEPLYCAITVRVFYSRCFSLIGAKVLNANGVEFKNVPTKRRMGITRKSESLSSD